METLHAVHSRRRSCIMEIYSHYNRYYVLLCRQEKDLTIDTLLFRRHLIFITFLSRAVLFTFPVPLCLETRNHKPFCSVDKSNFTTETCTTGTWIKSHPYTVGITRASDTLPLLCTAPPPPPPPRLHSVSASHVGPSHSYTYAGWGDAALSSNPPTDLWFVPLSRFSESLSLHSATHFLFVLILSSTCTMYIQLYVHSSVRLL